MSREVPRKEETLGDYSDEEGETIAINFNDPDPTHSSNPQFQDKPVRAPPVGKKALPAGKKLPVGRRGAGGGGPGGGGARTRVMFNSTNTIVSLDSTISQQNAKDAVRGVAMAILVHIKSKDTETDRFLDTFSEASRPLDASWRSEAVSRPDVDAVASLLRSLYDAAQLDAETLIVALVYVERVLSYSGSSLGPTTWRPVTAACMILAAKVWNDLAVWNVDFAAALPETPVAEINRVEVRVLEYLRYGVVVTAQQYARYFFEVRALPNREELLRRFKASAIEPVTTSSGATEL